MSSKTIHYCDLCNKEIDPELGITKLNVRFERPRVRVGFVVTIDYGSADICLHCVLEKINALVAQRAAQFTPYQPDYGTVDVRDEEER